MKLRLGVTPFINESTIIWLLDRVGLDSAVIASQELTWFPQKSDQLDESLLLVFSYPDAALIQAQLSGLNPVKALESWMAAAQELIDCFKANRGRATTVYIEAVLQQPEAVFKHLASECALEFRPTSLKAEQPPRLDRAKQDHRIVFELVAQSLISQSQRAQALAKQLEACSQPIENVQVEECTANYSQIAEWVRDAVAKNKERQTLKTTLDEVDVQLQLKEKQFSKLQQELEDERVVSAKLKSEFHTFKVAAEESLQSKSNELQRLAKETENSLATHLKEKAALQEENRIIIDHLHLVQLELERQFDDKQRIQNLVTLANKQHEQALRAANDQINELSSKLNRIRNSAAWKIGAPVRAISRPFSPAFTKKRELKKLCSLLLGSQYFDADWYLETYPDVAESSFNAAEHYIKFGANEGRNPGPNFDTQWYLRVNVDVADSGINPLIHFLKHGYDEGRAPSPQSQSALPAPKGGN